MNWSSFLKSRTIWSVLGTVAVTDVNESLALIPDEYSAIIVTVLGLLAAYFRARPKQII